VSCRLVNVRVEILRPDATKLSDRHTLTFGNSRQVAVLDGSLEETTEEEREALAGLDASPTMRFIAYHSYLLRVRDRVRVEAVKDRWRERFGHLSGQEYVVLSTSNSFRGTVGFLGPASAEGI